MFACIRSLCKYGVNKGRTEFDPTSLNQEIEIKDMIQEENQSGFVAGTLVHTDKGLVPIEQIKVGDMVLSKSESGEGEQVYKPILNSFKSPDKHVIYRITFLSEKILLNSEDEYSNENGDEIHLFCSKTHPFWVENRGWVPANQLQLSEFIIDKDGFRGQLIDIAVELYALPDHPTIAYAVRYEGWRNSHLISDMLIDFSHGKPILLGGGGSHFRNGILGNPDTLTNNNYWYLDADIQWLKDDDQDPFQLGIIDAFNKIYFNSVIWNDDNGQPINQDSELFGNDGRKKYIDIVYNIEVEDNHTYYVGKAGIWIHDASANIS